MKLDDIVRAIGPASVTGRPGVDVTGIAYDSRQARPGCLFAALEGVRQNGRDYIADAVSRGAAAVLSGPQGVPRQDVVHVMVDDPRRAMADAAACFNGYPSRRMKLVGITGTNGKTTIAFLARDILAAAGLQPGLIGTVRYEIGGRTIPARRTTPEAPDIQAMLAEMLNVGCKSAAMEVSSHALSLKRVWGLDFDVAVFTNLSGEHLDYHKTMENYFEAKLSLFRWLGAVKKTAFRVVNLDNPWGRRLAGMRELPGTLVTYGISPDAMVRAENLSIGRDGSSFTLKSPWGDTQARLALMGRFNVSNSLAAFAACGAMGIAPRLMAEAASRCACVPGRLEEVQTGKGFQVFVDYAHTEDALRNVLGAVRECKPRKLILVFGCGGDRDRTKRKPMGAAASELADYSIVTSDNSRGERTADIISQIKEGFDNAAKYEVVEDRAEAIRRALGVAGKGDIVVIAGKGHETFQEQQNTTTPFDDRQVARSILG